MQKNFITKNANHHTAATANIIITKNIRSAIVIIAKILPRQPQLRSPYGKLSDKSAIISPIKGVKSIDKKKVQPNPMRLLAPTKPTNEAEPYYYKKCVFEDESVR